jgi:hypothetical protein
LARKVLVRAIAKKKGLSLDGEEWIDVTGDNWPAIGEEDDPKNPIVMISEEAYVTTVGYCVQAVTPAFFEMAAKYIPQLSTLKPLL